MNSFNARKQRGIKLSMGENAPLRATVFLRKYRLVIWRAPVRLQDSRRGVSFRNGLARSLPAVEYHATGLTANVAAYSGCPPRERK